MRAILFIVLLSVASCASKPRTEEEQLVRDYNQAMAVENYEMCAKVYKLARAPMYHEDHGHPDNGRGVKAWMIKRDLLVNRCRMILGERWAKAMEK